MGFQTEATTIKMEKSGIRTIKQKKYEAYTTNKTLRWDTNRMRYLNALP